MVDLCYAVCAEAFNPDEDEEDKEPWVNILRSCFNTENLNICRSMFDISSVCTLTWGASHDATLYFNFQITHPKTDEQRQRLQEACRDILLFKNLDPVSGSFHKHSVFLWFVLCHLLNYIKEDVARGQGLSATAQCAVHDF